MLKCSGYVCECAYIYITRIYIPTITYLLPLNIWANCTCANNYWATHQKKKKNNYWAIYVLFL